MPHKLAFAARGKLPCSPLSTATSPFHKPVTFVKRSVVIAAPATNSLKRPPTIDADSPIALPQVHETEINISVLVKFNPRADHQAANKYAADWSASGAHFKCKKKPWEITLLLNDPEMDLSNRQEAEAAVLNAARIYGVQLKREELQEAMTNAERGPEFAEWAKMYLGADTLLTTNELHQ